MYQQEHNIFYVILEFLRAAVSEDLSLEVCGTVSLGLCVASFRGKP